MLLVNPCDPVGIRTRDPQLRRLLLYPAELPDPRSTQHNGANLYIKELKSNSHYLIHTKNVPTKAKSVQRYDFFSNYARISTFFYAFL